MKKLVFCSLFLVLLSLYADDDSVWVSQPGWVTGPGSGDYGNQLTYLLPFGINIGSDDHYTDDNPVLYETDMGWPVPDENEENLRYLLFGDTKFFMRDGQGHLMNKITDGNENTILSFDVSEYEGDSAEISKIELLQFLNISGPLPSIVPLCEDYSVEACANVPDKNKPDCEDNWKESCPTYTGCVAFCDRNQSLLDTHTDFSSEDKCSDFCSFAVVEAYACLGYFVYGEESEEHNPIIDSAVYNNGTSNIFLGASLTKPHDNPDSENYKITFENPDGSGTGSAQVSSNENPRESKSIWMSNFERELIGTIGIYPRGYFYACAGSPSDGCQSQKLFIPYGVGSWNFAENLKSNIIKDIMSNNSDINFEDASNKVTNMTGEEIYGAVKYQTKKYGVGIYDFEDECRIKFTPDNPDLPVLPDLLSCPLLLNRSECYNSQNSNPNKNILWPAASRMTNMTVVHGLDLDPLSTDSKFDKYIYFMGTGETVLTTSISELTWGKLVNSTTNSQKVYIARVPAYESEIMCASSYEYFSGISNGISRWSKNMDEAQPLYSFYPMDQMGAESIIKYRDLYWMTAPLNETELTASGTDEKGVVVLASPDGLNWQKMDKILFDKPENIRVDYAFFWLPSGLIDDTDNAIPFLYSIWKSNVDSDGKYNLKGFLDSDLDPKFTHYNLKMGKYEFMKNNETRAFLVNDSVYGNLLTNTIPGKISGNIYDNNPIFNYNREIVPLPFKGFQNLDNLENTDQTPEEIEIEKDLLKKRYAIVEYCNCGTQSETDCKKTDSGLCPPFRKFLTDAGNGEGNWKIIDVSDNNFFENHVELCANWTENGPDYMCDIPFEHGEGLPAGITSNPFWSWRSQIATDTGADINNVKNANVILRFSHWYGESYEQDNFTKINTKLMENNKIVPYNCEGDNLLNPKIKAACEDPGSWRTTKLIKLEYKPPFNPNGNFEYDPSPDIDPVRIEYLFPYPVMIKDFGGPGDPAHKIGDLMVANHLTNDFFKVSSFEYGQSAIQTLTPGFAMTSIITSNSMHIYAWGGMTSSIVLLNNSSTQIAPERVLFTGSFDPETEIVTMEQSVLSETAGSNSPSMTAGASMVYDEINGKIYLIGALDKTGVSRIYRLDTVPQTALVKTWTPVAVIDSGTYFRLVKKSEREYFVVGGLKTDGSFNTKVFLLNLDDVSSPQLIANIPNNGLANSFAAYNEKSGKLYIFGGKNSNGTTDRFLSLDTKTLSWNEMNISNGPGAAYGGVILVNYVDETLSLGGGNFENPQDALLTWTFDETSSVWTKQNKDFDLSYCLNETNDILKGGLGVSGICAPFTHPWYRQFSAGATVYSVAGKGDRLYVGTSSSIKIYDISDPAAMTLKYTFSTNSRIVYDLEVADGDIMYAATSKGIYKLSTANPDTLTSLTFYSTGSYNYQYKIQLYNDKLYVGDDNGINIRDKNTFARLAYVNTGSILDFAVADGEIASYWSAFWDEGIQIRDADTLNMKAYDYATCYTGELTADHGEFYISCDGYEYRFEGLPNTYLDYFPVDGDIREMQENYAYNGWAYIPDGSFVKQSTSNDVPAVCGNGVTEPGELCDGNSVECTTLDPDYTGGSASCNSTCSGYNEMNCETDGW